MESWRRGTIWDYSWSAAVLVSVVLVESGCRWCTGLGLGLRLRLVNAEWLTSREMRQCACNSETLLVLAVVGTTAATAAVVLYGGVEQQLWWQSFSCYTGDGRFLLYIF